MTLVAVDGEALLRAVHERPWDDGARLVYADWLTERGDPRGEFIVLGAERARGPIAAVQQRREKQLLDRHWKQWVEPIAPHLLKTQLRFERGFLAACCWRTVSRPKMTAAIGHSVWSTVEELTFRDGSAGGRPMVESGEQAAHPVVHLIADPAMRSLRVVEGIGSDEMAALCTLERPLRLESAHFFGHQPLDDHAIGLLSPARSLPALTELGYVPLDPYRTTPPALRWLVKSPIARRLERLIVGEQSRLAEWFVEMSQAAGELPWLEVRRSWNMQNRTQFGWRHAIGRGRSGEPSVLRSRYVPWQPHTDASLGVEMASELGALPADRLTELFVDGAGLLGDEERESIKRASRRFVRLDRFELDGRS